MRSVPGLAWSMAAERSAPASVQQARKRARQQACQLKELGHVLAPEKPDDVLLKNLSDDEQFHGGTVRPIWTPS